MRLLFASPEIFPMAKTGGLGEVSDALPAALAALGVDVRLVMPAYPSALRAATEQSPPHPLATFAGLGQARVIQARTPSSALPLWLIDAPALYDRGGGPYQDEQGRAWPDNLARFAMLSRAAALLASESSPLAWRPDVLHANDWQSGLAVALALREPRRPRLVFTVHNMAFAGIFPGESFNLTGLPVEMSDDSGIGVDEGFSLLKAGLQYADWVTTVSPTYAREIQTPEFGYGFADLLARRSESLSGIPNGIDRRVWDPARDQYIAAPYNADDLSGKRACKQRLLESFGLRSPLDAPLFGIVSRMTEQKGLDLVPAAIADTLGAGAGLVVLGQGEAPIEQAFRDLAASHPGRVGVRFEYDEAHAHAIEAGADIFLMPSRFEPSGLNQMYSQLYGTPPIVGAVGGLADSVVNAIARTLHDGTATGFSFFPVTAEGLRSAIERALALFAQPEAWRALQQAGMRQDFSWSRSARQYLDLYNSI